MFYLNFFFNQLKQISMKQQNAKSRIQEQLSQQMFGRSPNNKHIIMLQQVPTTSGKIKKSQDINDQYLNSPHSIKRDFELSKRKQEKNKQTKIAEQMQQVDLKILSEDFDNMFEHKYKTLETLGQGAHAIVKKVISKQNPDQFFAVKICRSGDTEIISTFIDTYRNNRFLEHPLIIKSHEIYIDEQIEALYQIMEYSSFPSLAKILKKQKSLRQQYNIHIFFSEAQAQKIVFQLASAIKHMHERGISHRDLKPDNILVDQSFNDIKIIDLGVSKRFRYFFIAHHGVEVSFRDMWTRTGNYLYLAPEIYQGGGYNESVDLWAVGMILYQMLTGKVLFHQETIYDTIEMIIQFDGNLDLSHIQASTIAKDCLRRLLNPNPKFRLSAEGNQNIVFFFKIECLKHPWFYQGQNDFMWRNSLHLELTPTMIPSPEKKFERSKNSRSFTYKESFVNPYQQKNEMVQYTKIKSNIGKEIHIHRKMKKIFSLALFQFQENEQYN